MTGMFPDLTLALLLAFAVLCGAAVLTVVCLHAFGLYARMPGAIELLALGLSLITAFGLLLLIAVLAKPHGVVFLSAHCVAMTALLLYRKWKSA